MRMIIAVKFRREYGERIKSL